jgi:hypothetical protein
MDSPHRRLDQVTTTKTTNSSLSYAKSANSVDGVGIAIRVGAQQRGGRGFSEYRGGFCDLGMRALIGDRKIPNRPV